jgi:hypothetical protein
MFSSAIRGLLSLIRLPTPSSLDSVLIIENNCGLSEAFLSNQDTTKPTTPESEKKIAPKDEGRLVLQ